MGLPVSRHYIAQVSRKGMVLFGCILGAVFLTYFFFDAAYNKNSFISSGVLSSGHANLQKKCDSCHNPGHSVADALCSGCHEKTSIHDIYGFNSHYIYRSQSADRVSPEALNKHAGKEMSCSSCHVEHRGKEANISLVSDKKCLSCHEFGAFNQDHPEFDFAKSGDPDDSTLLMTHIRHTAFVLKETKGISSIDALFQSLKIKTMDFTHFFEEACLYCHTPDSDGKSFQNINFEKHCARCHLKADAIVQGLPVFNPVLPEQAGVETIRQLQFRGGPGLSWAFSANPNLTYTEDGEVTKNSIYHKDPWIMENLRQIRKKLFPGTGLFDLLDTSGEVTQQRVDTLYNQAIRQLQSQTNELQNRSELKGELGKINILLDKARQQLQKPLSARSKARFQFPFNKTNQRLSESQRATFLQLAVDLTAEGGPQCRKCHIVANASVARVSAAQGVLINSEFNHRAHVLEKRCLECHTEIPITENIMKMAVENYATFKEKFSSIYHVDRAETQNIPKLLTCQKCHSDEKVSNSCTTCHKFHPNKRYRSSLQTQSSGWH